MFLTSQVWHVCVRVRYRTPSCAKSRSTAREFIKWCELFASKRQVKQSVTTRITRYASPVVAHSPFESEQGSNLSRCKGVAHFLGCSGESQLLPDAVVFSFSCGKSPNF